MPFKTVYLHGLVRDTKNRKISKSLGNNIDPLDMIAKYGADAVRMSLVVGVGPGNDSKIDEQKIKAYKLFSNKLWNVARFVLSSADGERGKDQQKAKPIAFDPGFDKWTPTDAAHKKELNDLVAEITKEMDEYKFYLVSEKLYHYVWHSFADKILEESKTILFGADNEKNSESRIQLLLLILQTVLRALHPFMPYITEEIWSEMPDIVRQGKSVVFDGRGMADGEVKNISVGFYLFNLLARIKILVMLASWLKSACDEFYVVVRLSRFKKLTRKLSTFVSYKKEKHRQVVGALSKQ